jgi:hypothetical protein
VALDDFNSHGKNNERVSLRAGLPHREDVKHARKCSSGALRLRTVGHRERGSVVYNWFQPNLVGGELMLQGVNFEAFDKKHAETAQKNFASVFFNKFNVK